MTEAGTNEGEQHGSHSVDVLRETFHDFLLHWLMLWLCGASIAPSGFGGCPKQGSGHPGITRPGIVREARIGLGGAATVPWRAGAAEEFLAGKSLSEDVAMEAGRIAFNGAEGREHTGFKIPLGQNTVARALLEVAALGTPRTRGNQ